MPLTDPFREGDCMATDLTISVEDRPGGLASIGEALGKAGIKVEGEADAILGPPVQGAETPGTMGAMARQIADAGINVRAAYLATNSRVVMVTDDNMKLMDLMKNM